MSLCGDCFHAADSAARRLSGGGVIKFFCANRSNNGCQTQAAWVKSVDVAMRFPLPIHTPETISERVLQACRLVVPTGQPEHVAVALGSYSAADDCHQNVAEKVFRDGGSLQSGWVIWEVPPWEIQLEFHSVWRSTRGCLLDLTPPLHGGPVVLFLPDSLRVYDGRNISTVRYPYSDDPSCLQYVEIAGEINSILLPPGAMGRPENVERARLSPLFAQLREIVLKNHERLA